MPLKINLFIIHTAAILLLVLTIPTNNLINATTTTLSTTTDIQNLLDFPETNFTKWEKTLTYASSTKYYARGMGPLYNATHNVLHWFVGKEAIPEGYIVVTDGTIQLGPKAVQGEWSELLKHYWGILLVVVITALIVVLMPIIGLCFCCCRCAGACGGRSQPFDKKHDTCRRVFLGLLLICSTTGILFGVVVTFTTNAYMQEGVNDAVQTGRHGSADIQVFLKSTSEQIDHLLIRNYDQLSTHLKIVLEDTSTAVINELKEKSKAISLLHLTEFLDKLPQMRQDLERMKEITNELRVNASQLSDGLRGVKRELLVMLTKCNTNECKEVLEKYQIGKLDANEIDYNQIPDLTEVINGVHELITDKIGNVVKNGNEELKKLHDELNKKITKYAPKIKSAIDEAGKAIKKAANQISGRFQAISNVVGNYTNKYVDETNDVLNEYGMYRFYAGVGLSTVILLVLAFLTCALFCGVCGKRPDGYGDDCCNKGSGSRFLMLAITVIFLSISILALATLFHFLAGLILYRGVCITARNPENDQVFQYIDQLIDFNNAFNPNTKNNKYSRNYQSTGDLPPFRISHIVLDCQANKTIYEVLRLSNHNDINHILDYPNEFKINETLDELVRKIDDDINTNLEILNDEDKKKILAIADSELKNFSSDKFVENLNDRITKFSLRDIAKQLRETADKISSSSSMAEIRVGLRNQALHLETYQDNLVIPMTKHSEELINLSLSLEKNLKLRDLPFASSINQIVKEIELAQDFIKTDGKIFLTKAAIKLKEHFTGEISHYLHFVVRSVEKEVGKCAPLAHVYDSGLVAICNKFVDPLNGFWAGIGWCILIFLPTIIISAKLSTLYQKSDPYPGPLVESEYLYDAYERDNIPLANGPKNKRRKKERRRGSRDRRGDYYEESGSNTGSAGRDTRYNDMAPKHWDGGPPRYISSAPPASEYERPPPYYYPGAAEE